MQILFIIFKLIKSQVSQRVLLALAKSILVLIKKQIVVVVIHLLNRFPLLILKIYSILRVKGLRIWIQYQVCSITNNLQHIRIISSKPNRESICGVLSHELNLHLHILDVKAQDLRLKMLIKRYLLCDKKESFELQQQNLDIECSLLVS